MKKSSDLSDEGESYSFKFSDRGEPLVFHFAWCESHFLLNFNDNIDVITISNLETKTPLQSHCACVKLLFQQCRTGLLLGFPLVGQKVYITFFQLLLRMVFQTTFSILLFEDHRK